MKFYNSGADIHVPDGAAEEEALGRTTYMSIAAHQDDCEIMAYHAIAKCYGAEDDWYTQSPAPVVLITFPLSAPTWNLPSFPETITEALSEVMEIAGRVGIEIIYNPAPARKIPPELFPYITILTPNRSGNCIIYLPPTFSEIKSDSHRPPKSSPPTAVIKLTSAPRRLKTIISKYD